MDAIDKAAEILTRASDAFLPRLPGGSGDGTPNRSEVSPALQAAIFHVLRAELYVSYVGGEGQGDHLHHLERFGLARNRDV